MYYKVTLARKDNPDFDVVVSKYYRANQSQGLTYEAMEAEIRAYGYVLKWYTAKMAYYKYTPEAM